MEFILSTDNRYRNERKHQYSCRRKHRTHHRGKFRCIQYCINIRNLHNIIFASPYKSRIRNLQSIGRGCDYMIVKSLLSYTTLQMILRVGITRSVISRNELNCIMKKDLITSYIRYKYNLKPDILIIHTFLNSQDKNIVLTFSIIEDIMTKKQHYVDNKEFLGP